VLWGLVAVGVIGILLGFRVRAPALIVMTAVIVAFGAAAGGIGSLFDWDRLLSILLFVVTLQCAYLLGVFLGVVWRRGMTHEQ
jgi:phage shock protein PspC (stress-responsive transcriptional regulator)